MKLLLADRPEPPARLFNTVTLAIRPMWGRRYRNPDRADLVVPFDDVRDHAGRVIGCRALARLVPPDGG
jgi:hypothetical protein